MKAAGEETRVSQPLFLDDGYRQSQSREEPTILHEQMPVENEGVERIRVATD